MTIEEYNNFNHKDWEEYEKTASYEDKKGILIDAEIGDETLCYGGGYEYHSGEFDIKFLTMSDEELDEYVKHENEIFEQKKKEEETVKKQKDLELKRRLFEKLKNELNEN